MPRRARVRLTDREPLSGPPIGPRGALFLAAALVAAGVLVGGVALGLVAPASSPDAPPDAAILLAVGASLLLAGAFVAAHGAMAHRRERMRGRNADRLPLQPWLWDHPWSRHGQRDDGHRQALGALFWSAFLIVFLAPGNFIALRLSGATIGLAPALPYVTVDAPGGWPGPAFFVAAAFAIVGDALAAGVLALLVLRAARLARHGRAELAFDAFPFLVGSELRARLRLPSGGRGVQTLHVALRYIEEEIETDAQGREEDGTRIAVCQLYLDERRIDDSLELARLGHGLPLAFRIPADLPPTDLSAWPRSYWQLDVAASADGPDYRGRFLLPVYSASGLPAAPAAPAAHEARARAAVTPGSAS